MLFKRYDRIICLCDAQKTEFVSLFGEKCKGKISICYNLIDIENIDRLKDESVDFDGAYILSVARLDRRSKDFETLIDSWSQLPLDCKKNYELVIAGDGDDRNALEQYAAQKGQSATIHFIGNQINPYKWMKNASLFVLSSKSEGFSLVVSEALACECAVISSDCVAGPADILQGGKYGFLFSVGNIEQLTNCMNSLLSDGKQKDLFKMNARKRVLEMNAQGLNALHEILEVR